MNLFSDVFSIFYPEVCQICNTSLTTNEQVLCINCRHDLPLTHFTEQTDNLLEKTFYGRCKIEQATALFYFLKPGNVQTLIHKLKYKNQEQIGSFSGNWLGEEIAESNRFKNIDFIIPVPLHKNKLKKRGYNQVTTFGKSLSQKLNVPYVENILTRVSFTHTQTKKIRLDRWKNVKELFFIENSDILTNKHILLIDDVVTTGATLEACCNALFTAKNIKISIACIAYTK